MTLRTSTLALFAIAFAILLFIAGLFTHAHMTHPSAIAQVGLLVVLFVACLLALAVYAYVQTIQPRHRKQRSQRKTLVSLRNTVGRWSSHGAYLGPQEVIN